MSFCYVYCLWYDVRHRGYVVPGKMILKYCGLVRVTNTLQHFCVWSHSDKFWTQLLAFCTVV